MVEGFEDVESVRAAFALWPGTVFRCAVCGEVYAAARAHEWSACAIRLAWKWGLQRNGYNRVRLRASVGFSLEPPLFVRVTRAGDVERVESLLGERCPVPPAAAGSPAELLALRHDILDQVMHAAWENWWEMAAEYTRMAVRAAYDLEPRELPEEFLSDGRACQALPVRELARRGVAVAVGRLGICYAGQPEEWVEGVGLVAKVFSAGLTLQYRFPEATDGKKFGRDPFWLARVIDSAVPV